MQNPMDLLDIEKRTGIKDTDVDDFLKKTTDVQEAIEAMMRGDIKPEDVKVEGIDTPEEEAAKKAAKEARLAESRRKAEDLRVKRAAEEKERWWTGAEYCNQRKVKGKDNSVEVDNGEESLSEAERIRQRYSQDYSRWNDWVPTDEATLEETRLKEEEEETKKNKEFEDNNKEFCDNFITDMAEREKSMAKKKSGAEECRTKGNRHFKRKEWDLALEQYMESLKLQPYETKTLTNIAQVYIKQEKWDEALEFLSRTLYMDYEHAKAFSRKAFVLTERGDVADAVKVAEEALEAAQGNRAYNEKETADIAAQLHDLRVLAKEKGDEDKLQSVLTAVQAKATTAANANKDLATATESKASTNAKKVHPGASMKAAADMTDFEAVDQLWGVLGGLSSTTDTADLSVTPVSSSGDEQVAVGLLRDCMVRLEKNQMLRVYMRTKGLLERCVEQVARLTPTEAPAADTTIIVISPLILETLLHLLATALAGERAAKLLLVAKKSNLLQRLRDNVLPMHDKPSLVYAAVRLFLVCCSDDSCLQTRDHVLADPVILKNTAKSLGEALGRGQAEKGQIQPNGTGVPKINPVLNGLVETAATLVRTVTLNKTGQESLAKASPDTGAMIVTSMAFALQFAVTNALMADIQGVIEAMAKEGTASTDNFDEVMARMEAKGRNNKETSSELCVIIMEALLGCSQVENMRAYFAGEIPWSRSQAPTGTTGAGAKATKKASKEAAVDSNAKQVCVELITHACRAVPDLCTSGLAVLMNACLDPQGIVRMSVMEHGGYELSSAGFETLCRGTAVSKYSDFDWQTLCRQVGLLSRLAVLPELQKKMYEQKEYRRLCSALKAICTAGIAPVAGTREAELLSHCVRILAALNKPSAANIKAGMEESIIQTLLGILPEPKRELGQITASSVSLMPSVRVSSILIGNTARCLMPYADSAEACTILYSNRSLLSVEKLICAMATCTEMPVRQNLSVLVAKGCRVDGIREVVTDLRGMQMMQELQSKFKL